MPVVNHLNFFVTSETDCVITIELQDSIQGMVRMDWTVAEFFSDGGATSFANRLASVLGIHTSRIKVVGVSAGSVVVNYVIEPDPATVTASSGPVASTSSSSASSSSASSTSSSSTSAANLQSLQQNLMSMLASGSIDLGAPVLEYTVVVVAQDGTVESIRTVDKKEMHPAVTAMIVIACVALAASLVLWFVYQRFFAKTNVIVHHPVEANSFSDSELDLKEARKSPGHESSTLKQIEEDPDLEFEELKE